jgi:hypothetical protein
MQQKSFHERLKGGAGNLRGSASCPGDIGRRTLGDDVKLDVSSSAVQLPPAGQLASVNNPQKLKVTAIEGEPTSRLIVALIGQAHTPGDFMNRKVTDQGRAGWIQEYCEVTERSTPKR